MSTSRHHFAIASRRVVLPNGVRPAAVVIEGEQIAAIVEPSQLSAGLPVEDLGDLVIAPGIVDAHVHINEPGRSAWEGFETATRAAAAGGVTMLVDMPLNSSPVTTTAAALAAKRAAAARNCWVEVGFYGGLVPGNADQIDALIDAGVLGVKAFLCDSGLPEFPAATANDLRGAAPRLARANRPLLVHAELPLAEAPRPRDVRSYVQYVASRPPEWEAAAIELLIGVCRQSGCPVHIVHLANGDALPKIEAARRAGLPLSIETCPHYLHFADSDVPDGDTRFKCAPPIRDARHRELLWDALRRGTIDTIGSDHSPCLPEMKHTQTGDFTAAWGGIAGLQLMLPVVWTGASRRGFELVDVFRWLSAAPARLLQLSHQKGSLASGCDADVVVWDPAQTWIVRGEVLHHRHKLTPYEGQQLSGRVMQTYVRGRLVYDRGQFIGEPDCRLSLRERLPFAERKATLAEHLNRLDENAAREALTRCCAARAWVEEMLNSRPFVDDEAVLAAAGDIWNKLGRADWLEAFAAHPRIGDLNSLRAKFADTRRWAGGEQSGVAGASEATLTQLAALNDDYAARFGYIFIVCATGKSADEMLTLLAARLPNTPAAELPVAAAEQLKITRLRLQKLAP